jgi:hypothetical protein
MCVAHQVDCNMHVELAHQVNDLAVAPAADVDEAVEAVRDTLADVGRFLRAERNAHGLEAITVVMFEHPYQKVGYRPVTEIAGYISQSNFLAMQPRP